MSNPPYARAAANGGDKEQAKARIDPLIETLEKKCQELQVEVDELKRERDDHWGDTTTFEQDLYALQKTVADLETSLEEALRDAEHWKRMVLDPAFAEWQQEQAKRGEQALREKATLERLKRRREGDFSRK